MITFDEAFDRLINVEAGFTDNPSDDGNWTGGRQGRGLLKGTKYGIAANTYPDLDIRSLTLAEAKVIYHRDWWVKAGALDFDSAIVYQLWVFAVNANMETAKRALQRAVRVADDGQVGPRTVAAVKAMEKNDVLLRFTGQVIRHYTSLRRWPDFGKGWMNRTAEQLEYAAEDN
jgi:lysozyme family protein